MSAMLAVVLVAAVGNLALALHRTAAIAGAMSGSILLVVGLGSGYVWNWARVRNGSGLPTQYVADTSIDSAAAAAFLTAALGCFLGGILIGLLVSQAPSRPATGTDRVARLVSLSSMALLVMWCLGEGPSLWYRSTYLQTDGIPALLNAASLLGPLIGVAGLATASQAGTRWDRNMAYGLAGVWFIFTSCLGSRVSLLFPVLAYGLFLGWVAAKRSWFWSLLAAVLLYPLAYICLADFALTLLVRSNPHGLSMYLTNLQSPAVPQFTAPADWIVPLQWLGSSISASTVITEFSVAYNPGSEVLLINANPLPSGMASGVDPFSAERFWPYEWIPLSFAGEWYGALGPEAQVGLFAMITAYAGFGVDAYRRRGLLIGSAMILALVLLSMLISIQYPSRMFWRLISLIVVLPLGVRPLAFVLKYLPSRRSHASAL